MPRCQPTASRSSPSRRAGEDPQILAQTTLKKTKAPVLVLLTAKTPGGPYQVAAMTTVLPSAKIDPFDPTVETALRRLDDRTKHWAAPLSWLRPDRARHRYRR